MSQLQLKGTVWSAIPARSGLRSKGDGQKLGITQQPTDCWWLFNNCEFSVALREIGVPVSGLRAARRMEEVAVLSMDGPCWAREAGRPTVPGPSAVLLLQGTTSVGGRSHRADGAGNIGLCFFLVKHIGIADTVQ